VHKPSGIGKQLALFGVQEIHADACFVNNHCQIKTQVSNGGRVKFDLFEDYKNDEFFKYGTCPMGPRASNAGKLSKPSL
jgi:hypothetical protein